MNNYLKILVVVSILISVCVSSVVSYSITYIKSIEETLPVLGDAPTGGVTLLYPNYDGTVLAPLGWSSTPLLAPANWYQNLDENPPDGDTTYVTKTSGKASLTTIGFQDLLDGENPPPNENVVINNCTIYCYCKDYAVAIPSSNSMVTLTINRWSITGLSSIASHSYQYNSGSHSSVMGNPITVNDVNTARCNLQVRLGNNVEFRVTQMYIEVEWSIPVGVPTVIAGDVVIAGDCVIG